MAEHDLISKTALLEHLDMAMECENCPRNADKELYKCVHNSTSEHCTCSDIAQICIMITEFATFADVQPVKHGRWIETHISLCKWIPEDEKEEGHSFYMAELKCSCCGRYNAVTFVLTLNKPDFCQLCGARMDGETE